MHVTLAAAWLARLRGLHARPAPLLIAPARAIHTCGLRRPIDAVFLDADLRVVKIVRHLRPWRLAAARRAAAVLELEAGGAAGIEPGRRLALRP